MNVNPTHAAANAQAVAKLAAARKAYGTAPAQNAGHTRAADRLELSGASHLLQLAKTSDVRAEKVKLLKDQIESGTYDLDAKADVVADRLAEDLGL